ncbi:hypothetical protein DFQ28_003923 [Apophysomyces sp. BC1034]|nr:hypothetical protein DFQ29_009886 [Apophysomyces sp. BC1021]KAG0189075.1 hypothetical protein DFQ28_003923 [Apophysomyces sp. BC1034]
MVFYFTQRLSIGQPIPLVFFDYRFVNGVFQLVIGREWSNKILFSESIRAHIKSAFDEFLRLVPNAYCHLVPSTVQGKPAIAFSKILTSTSPRLTHLVPAFTRSQIIGLADFVYDSMSNHPDFPPKWPSIEYDPSLDHTSVDATVNDALLELIDETSECWNRLSVLMANDWGIQTAEEDSEGDDDADTMSLDAQSSADGSIATTNASTSTMGVSSLQTNKHLPAMQSICITTSTLTRYPHLSIAIMYEVLREIEDFNSNDAQLLPLEQQSVNKNCVYHHLSQMTDWARLNHRQRSKLVRALSKIINEGVEFDPLRLPRELTEQSRQQIITIIATTQASIQAGMFTTQEYLTRLQLRLFSILPVPSLTRKSIQVSHKSLAEIMRHFGLDEYALSNTAAASKTIHQNFKIFNMKKIKHG